MQLYSLIPAAAMLAFMFSMVYSLLYWKKHSPHFKGRNPLTSELLRSPGETLRKQIEDLDFDIAANLGMVAALPPLFLSMYLFKRLDPNASSGHTEIIYTVFAAIGFGYFMRKLMTLLKTRHRLKLGLSAEIAVAQELNALMLAGHRVFHDFPAEGFNIDHVVVGPTGVYAIETKGRSKPERQDGKKTWEITYDGNKLIFPDHTETEPLEQAQRQAIWLSGWLGRAVGESVAVKPALVFPGWFINRAKPSRIWLSNGKNMERLLDSPADAPLSEKFIRQICHQIDQRCRNHQS